MTHFGLMLVVGCSVSAAMSSFLLRWSIDNAGGFRFDLISILRLTMQPFFLVGVILYGLAGIGWFRVIATEPLSTAYPILVSLTFLLVSIGAVLIFKEPMGVWKILGIGMMIAGICFVAKA